LNVLWFNFALKVAGLFFDGCMAITPAMSAYISKHSAFKPSKIGIWSSAFDAELFDPKRTDRNDLGVSEDIPVVIYHGALTHNRMLKELVAAVEFIEQPMHLFILGGGPLQAELQRQISESPANHRITLHRAVSYEQVPAFLNAAHIGVVPIPDTVWFEVSMPIKLLEYMAMELTVIAPTTEPVRNVIGDSACDVVRYSTNGNAVDALAAAMNEALERIRNGVRSEANRQLVMEKFTWQAQGASIKAYLDYLVLNAHDH
jgi:glycosyltransferase involved in cell wall biosynthesis